MLLSGSQLEPSQPQVIKVSAPGKVILHGEHSVVYGKRAVALSLDLRTTLTLIPGGGQVRLNLPDIEINESWPVEVLHELRSKLRGKEEPGPSSLSEQQAAELRKFLGVPEEATTPRRLALLSFLHLYLSILPHPVPLTISVTSQLPSGSGLGSSAAYAVCLSAALLRLAGTSGGPKPPAPAAVNPNYSTVPGPPSPAGRPTSDCSHAPPSSSAVGANDDGTSNGPATASLEEVSAWAFRSEQIMHGTPSGIDNSICTFGGAVSFKCGSCSPVSVPPLRVLLVNTGVPRSTKALVSGVRERRHRLPLVVEPVLEALDSLADRGLEVLSQLASAHHHTEEDVAYATLHELIDINHGLLCALGVSHPSLDRLVGLARTHGLHGKLTGAGGGGFGVVVLGRDTPQATVDACHADLEAAGYHVWQTTLGAPGLTLHT